MYTKVLNKLGFSDPSPTFENSTHGVYFKLSKSTLRELNLNDDLNVFARKVLTALFEGGYLGQSSDVFIRDNGHMSSSEKLFTVILLLPPVPNYPALIETLLIKLLNQKNLPANSKAGEHYKLTGLTSKEHCLLALFYLNQLVSKMRAEVEANSLTNFQELSVLRELPVSSQERVLFDNHEPFQLDQLREAVDIDPAIRLLHSFQQFETSSNVVGRVTEISQIYHLEKEEWFRDFTMKRNGEQFRFRLRGKEAVKFGDYLRVSNWYLIKQVPQPTTSRRGSTKKLTRLVELTINDLNRIQLVKVCLNY